MKRLFPILSFLFVFSCEDKEEKEVITFLKTYGGSGYDIGYSVQQITDGGYILAGRKDPSGIRGSNLWLIKTDTEGNEIWNKQFGGSGYEWAQSVQQTTDGGYIITGLTTSFGNGRGDIWLIKTDSDGMEEWNKTFGGNSPEIGYSVQQTTDGGYIITGNTSSFGSGLIDIWLIKTDSQGIEEWNKSFGGKDMDQSKAVLQTRDGGYIILGETELAGNYGRDYWLIKTDSEGNKVWSQTFDKNELDIGRDIKQSFDDGFIIVGETWSFENGRWNVWLIKTNSIGNMEWNQIYDLGGYEHSSSVLSASDGGYIVTGIFSSFGNGNNSDILLIKTDSDGNMVWDQTFGGSSSDEGNSVQQTNDGGYIVIGSTNSFGQGGQDFILIKTDSEGNTVPYK